VWRCLEKWVIKILHILAVLFAFRFTDLVLVNWGIWNPYL